MVVFALANSATAGGYFIGSDHTSMGWQELPHDLASEIKSVRGKGEQVLELSTGCDGDWFLRTNLRHAWKSDFDKKSCISNVQMFSQHALKCGHDLTQYTMQFFTFVPNPTGYVTVLHKTDGSFSVCAWEDVPAELDAVLARQASEGNSVHHVTVGMKGSYVVVMNNGIIWRSGVPEPLNRLLADAMVKGRGVASVSLSLISDSWYFVEFADGSTNFVLPLGWHDTVNNVATTSTPAQGPKMYTSYNNLAPPPSYYSPIYAHPSPQPIIVNNVYHMPPAPRERGSGIEKYEGVIEAVGCALKIAVAILGRP
ncbi:hypothetical protein BC826DRAFT_73774 [Russula brevipes]|nr:hypothetical protein BC826DRAFT_73774 [Russula brevipes]